MMYLLVGCIFWILSAYFSNRGLYLIMQIARNITTNEAMNAVRYTYLRSPDGRFRNPYNHGCRKNCADFLIVGYTDDDETPWPSLQQVAH